MLFKWILTAGLLTAGIALPQTAVTGDDDGEPQPGIIRFAQISEGDRVSIDGEPVPSEGLRRSRYDLLIAPGIYTVEIRYAGSGRTCISRVVVPEDRVVEPSCVRRSGARVAD